ncbi:hypothetical protein KNO15_06515 [Leifsonia shinshuensis]|uniref:hypothetical protein n=1 Tax=Leifsonia shinshuensis TaxID=150026 RepID=UPI001F514FDD|nr:hypothetical protein [Leifsonia shinshuensis]MCI0156347.1 hypothetical protein [Leifsonia shinshuensis]
MMFEPDDELFPVLPPTRTRRPAGPEDLAATIAFTVILVAVGLFLSFLVVLEHMGVAACSASLTGCDYALLEATTWITPAATIAALGFAIVALARRPWSRRRTWWVPVLGLAFTACAFAVASALVRTALGTSP